MKGNNGNQIVRTAVVIGDMIIINAIMLLLTSVQIVHIPDALTSHAKLCWVSLNVAILASEYFFSSIIHIRRVNFHQIMGRTFKLVFFTCLVFYVLIIFLIKGGGR